MGGAPSPKMRHTFQALLPKHLYDESRIQEISNHSSVFGSLCLSLSLSISSCTKEIVLDDKEKTHGYLGTAITGHVSTFYL